MKKIQIVSLILLAITVLVMFAHFIFTLPDWIIRINGILMILLIFIASYSTFKNTNN